MKSFAFTTEDADALMDAYNARYYNLSSGRAYYNYDQAGGRTYFWGQAEEIEGQIDAYERSRSAAYKAKVIELLNGFSYKEGTNWSNNKYNDDIMWACIAYLRGYNNTSNTTFRSIAKYNFDMMYARAWDTKLGGGLYWTTDNAEKNACINGPAAIVAYMLYQTLNDTNYLAKSQAIFAWEKSKLFNASTGAIYDNINTNGTISTWASSYNQGTFIGAAHFLGDTASARLAMNYSMNNLGNMGWDNYKVLFEYGVDGNNSGFNAIGLRWMAKFMVERNLQGTYLKWLHANANAAWNVRRTTDNLSWCQWFHQTPVNSNLLSWDCISSVVALQVVPPDETADILTATITATPSVGSQWPLTVQFTGQGSGAPVTAGPDTTADRLGTITARGQLSSESFTNAFDDDIDSKWLDVASTSWIQYQYSNNVQQTVGYYRITSGNDSASYPGRNPRDWQLLGSNNGTTWTILDSRQYQNFPSSKYTRGYAVSNPQPFNMYKLALTSNGDTLLQLDEIQLLSTPVYSYLWSFGDGTTSTLQNPQHTYTKNGNFRVTLTVSCDSFTGTSSTIVTVGPPLAASMTAVRTNGATPLSLQFNSQGSGGNGAAIAFDTTETPGTVSAQGDNAPNEAMTSAFDNTNATKWLDFANSDQANRSSWIQYQYADGAAYTVTQYAITTANDAPERDPKTWRLLGSNNGGASWVTLDTRSTGFPTNRYYRSLFTITNTAAAFNIYQLKIDSVANKVGTTTKQANSVQLAEIELIGRPAYSYFWNFGDGTTSTSQNPMHSYLTNGNYTATLIVSDGTAFVTNSISVSAIPFYLSTTSSTAGAVTLSWPAWTPSCHLYTTTNLFDPAAWTLVPESLFTNGIAGSITIPTTSENCYYQLRTP